MSRSSPSGWDASLVAAARRRGRQAIEPPRRCSACPAAATGTTRRSEIPAALGLEACAPRRPTGSPVTPTLLCAIAVRRTTEATVTGRRMLLDVAAAGATWATGKALVRAAAAQPAVAPLAFVDPMPEERAITEVGAGRAGWNRARPCAGSLMDLASHRAVPEAVGRGVAQGRQAESIGAEDLGDVQVLGVVLESERDPSSYSSRIDDRVRDRRSSSSLGGAAGWLAMALRGRHALGVADLERGELDAWRDEFSAGSPRRSARTASASSRPRRSTTARTVAHPEVTWRRRK